MFHRKYGRGSLRGLGAGQDRAGLEPNAWGDEEIFKREPFEVSYSHVGSKKNYYHTVPLYMVDEAGGSDYGGGTANESNYRLIAAMDFPQIVRLYGGYNSYGIVLRLDMGPLPKELIDIVAGLADYPVIDEGDWSELEMEAENESWENYGRADWRRELSQHFDDEIVDELDRDQLDKLWYGLDLSWRSEIESGGSAYFNFKEAIRRLKETNPTLAVLDGLRGARGRRF